MRVIGTAGHVDHGKSALIEALTGTHPDRLREEQERGLTIVLGFAWLTLPSGEEIGIVDVPGHRDFIENMLSGVGAIDAALFVVAADEGVMPQTREHLAILDLLQIQGGVVALTKIDLIEDPEWLDLVEAELQDELAGTVLASAPMVRVSAETGEGLPELMDVLDQSLAEKPSRSDLGRPRLSVDRAFTVEGFGTVVTGTLTDGHLKVGDEVVILPQGVEGRVRGLQTHQRETQIALPGSRTAINISGVDVDQIKRGNVVAHPGEYRSTGRVDVQFRHLPDANKPIKHDMDMKFFVGAAEMMARLRLLGTDELAPGAEGWLQLELKEKVVVTRGDRYILRRPSPPETIGGGAIIDPHPKGRYKRFDQATLDRFEAFASGAPKDVLAQTLTILGITSLGELIVSANLNSDVAERAVQELLQEAQVFLLSGEEIADHSAMVVGKSYWARFRRNAEEEVLDYHRSYPLRQGIPREELKSRLKVTSEVFDAAMQRMAAEGRLVERSIRRKLPGVSPIPVVHHSEHEVRFAPEQKEKLDHLLDQFDRKPYSPPTIKESVNEVGEEVYNALVDAEQLIPVSEEVVFRWEDYQKMVDDLREYLVGGKTISVARLRDRLDTSRRYALAFLEHLDSVGVTVRVGDVRELREESK